MWGLILGACILCVAIGLRVDGKVGDTSFSVMVALALVSGIAIAYFGSTKKVTAGPDGVTIEMFRKEANAITEEALDKLKKVEKEVSKQREALTSVIETANQTREDLLRVAQATAPPYLSFESKQVEQTEEGYKVNLRFNPSKNEPFGTIVFRADIIGDSEAIIKQLRSWKMNFSGKTKLSAGGKTATTAYGSPSVRQEEIILIVSAPCKVRISGSHMRENLELEIK